MQQFVRIKLTVPGLHHWPNAPDQTAFLRHPHRHQFGFEVDIPVTHGDRDVEFFDFQRLLEIGVWDAFRQASDLVVDFGAMSCEMIAAWVLDEYPEALRCTVSEDGENLGGAIR